MDVKITDAVSLRRISPTMMRAYLQMQGWTQEEIWHGRIVVWSNAQDEEVREILVPLREQSDVYAMRMSEAMATLSEVEERSQLYIYYDLLSAGADVIRLRSLNGSGRSEWSLSESVAFLTRALDLVRASARFAERPGHAVYRGGISSKVSDYVREVRPLPGYETGTDLILHSPVQATYGEQEYLSDSVLPPFPRRVTIALNNGLREAGRTVETVLGGAQIADAFEASTKQGVTANFCDAIGSLASQTHGVGVSLSWAKVRPSDISDEEFKFAESAADVLAEGAGLLRQRNPFMDAHVTGEIVQLDRESQEKFDGRAVVLYELDGRPVALHTQFDITDREEVVRAFRDTIEISVDGDIYREGRRYFLKNLRNFELPAATP